MPENEADRLTPERKRQLYELGSGRPLPAGISDPSELTPERKRQLYELGAGHQAGEASQSPLPDRQAYVDDFGRQLAEGTRGAMDAIAKHVLPRINNQKLR